MAIFIGKNRIMTEDLEATWDNIKTSIPEHLRCQARTVLIDWINAPSTRDIDEQEQRGQQPLQYAFEKTFSDLGDLALAIKGNVLAATSLQQEEAFALYLLEHFKILETLVLAPLVNAVGEHFASLNAARSALSTQKDAEFLDAHWFGPVAKLEWVKGWEMVHRNIRSGEPIEQLYKIITMICRYNWPFKLSNAATAYRLGPTPGREEFAASKKMRLDFWTINEAHPQVIADRAKGIPIWGGISGTTMDLMHTAKTLGITDSNQLTALAYAIAMYFHFAPTKYVVHTFHEVMRGAKIIAPEINYDPLNPSPPSCRLIDELFVTKLKLGVTGHRIPRLSLKKYGNHP